jgi:hypothetical protein
MAASVAAIHAVAVPQSTVAREGEVKADAPGVFDDSNLDNFSVAVKPLFFFYHLLIRRRLEILTGHSGGGDGICMQ